jgi:hypothetical protein
MRSGYATLDLAELAAVVGHRRRSVAGFLAALRAAASARGPEHRNPSSESRRVELGVGGGRVWCRWVAAFVADPEALVEECVTR